MKKATSIILALALTTLLSVTAFGVDTWNGTADTSWYEQNPTATEYTITTAEQLAGLAKLVDEGTTNFEGVTINLGADIDLNNKNWEPIGFYGDLPDMNKMFNGTLDGQNHKIDNIKIDRGANGSALFSINYGVIKNLTLASGDIKSDLGAGGIVGQNYGTIENCTNKANITVINNAAGGIATGNYSTIMGCSNEGAIAGKNALGGIVSGNYGTIIDSNNKGTVKATGDLAGGIAAGNLDTNGLIINCYNTGAIKGNQNVGGVVGNGRANSTTQNCYNAGTINGSGSVGGVVGYGENSSRTQNCYNAGTVTGTAGNVGGVVGWGRDNNATQNCYNTGTINGSVGVGGVVGQNSKYAIIQNCYNTGTINGSGSVGGVVGDSWENSNLQACYSSGVVTGNSNVGGVAGKLTGNATAKYVYYLTGKADKAIGTSSVSSTATDVKAYTTNAEVAEWLTRANTTLGIVPHITWSVGRNGNIVPDVIIGLDKPDEEETIKDNSPPSFAELEYQYFTEFSSKIKAAKAGDIIAIDAKYYESLPASMIDTLYGKDITIRITKDGKTVDIHGLKVPAPSKNRAYYPISYFMAQ